MVRFYNFKWCVFLALGFLSLWSHPVLSQCSITNLNASYCLDDAPVVLTGGTNYYGPGISGSTFTPSVAGLGTHTIYSATAVASSYSIVTSGSYNPDVTAASAVTFPSLPGDENSNTLGIGFTFNFFGTDYTDLVVNANGYVMFGGTTSANINQTLPSVTDPDNLIAGAWDNLDITAGGTVTTVLVGSSPTRKLIINFNAVRHSGAPQTVTFQIQLHESTNIIEIHSQDVQFDGGGGMTQGIENGNGTSAYSLPSRNNANWTASSDYIAFVPSCVDIRSVSVTSAPANNLAVSAPATICPGSGAPVTIGTSQSGILYQLQRVSDSAPLSLFSIGNGGNLIITSDPLAVSTDIKVYALNSVSGCDGDLTNTVTVDPSLVAPVITLQPVNSTICEGINTSFTVNAGLTTIPTYQWQVSTNSGVSYSNLTNTGIYSGVTTATLNLTGAPLANNGYLYRVQVGGTCTPVVTSNGALLTVDQNPVITTQPLTQIVCEGSTVVFTVGATGTGLTYQWQKGGVDIGGETSSSLTLPAVVAATAGNYRVIVRGTCDATGVISNVAGLTVNEVPEITLQPVNSTICEGTNTSFTVNAGLTTLPTYQWQVSTNSGVTYSNLTNTGIYSGVTTATLSLTGAPLANNGYLYRVQVGGTCTPVVTSNGALLTVDQNPVITTQPLTQIVCEGSTVVFTVGATGTGLTYQWQKGGVDIGGETSSSLTLPAVVAATAGNYRVIVRGTCDATGVISNVAGLTVNEVPEITLQPVNSTICEGTNTSFTVSAGLTTLPTYQWQVSTNSGVSYSNLTNTGIYSGVTTATLNLTGAPLANNGYLYRVQVGGTCTPVVTSNGALLTVDQNPVITTQPLTQIVCEGSTVVFSVTATGTGLTYQWQKGAVDIGGETSSSLTLPAVVAATAGNYRVIVRGTCDATGVISNVAGLTVNEVPEITLQPVNSTICEGTNTSFTVNAGLTTLPTYQWQVSTNSGVSYSNLTNTGIYSGVTTATLNLTGAPLANNGYLYRVQVGGTCTPVVTSNGALLTVDQNPVITTQPLTQIVCEGSTVVFTVGATGTGLTYQWQKGAVDIGGETSSSLTLPAVVAATGGNYRVIVRGTCDATGVISNVAGLTVNEVPEITLQPVNSTICEGTNTSFTVNAGLTTLPTYQWQVSTNSGVSYSNLTNTGIYSGVTTATLNLTGAPLANNGYLYRVQVGGTCTPVVTSNGALLTVDQNPVITTQPLTQIVCEGSTVVFTVAATGTGLTYQWQKGGVDIGGETSSSLTLPAVVAATAGNYRVIVRGTCDATGVISNVAGLTVNEVPEITLQPVNSTICEGTNTSFTVSAGLTTLPTYQWQVSTNSGVSYSNLTNTGIYSGVTTATLNLTGAPLANNGYLYRVQVGGTCTPVVTSNGALLTVDQNPVITTQPLTQIVCEGSTVVFTVAATGTGLTYQWQKGGVDIGGETTSSLTLPAVVAATAGNYRVIVRGTCDATGVISNVAGLTVNEVPEITLQPVNSTICEGTNTSFTVSAGLTTLPTYQWQVSTNSGVSYSNLTNTGIYSGVTTATLNLTGAPLANNGYLYRVQVGGTCTPVVTSNGALLTVDQNPVITTQPLTQIVCEGSTVVFTVAATGTGLTYQWQKGAVDIGGETSSSLTLPAVVAATGGNYRVIVRGTCDATGVISNVAGLTVNEVPEITLQPVNSTICEGTNTSFTVNAGITTIPTYQWQVSTNSGVSYSNLTNTGIYSGVTTATLNLTGAPLANNGYLYRVQVGGTCTPVVTSNGALLTVDQNPVITTQPLTQIVCEGSTVVFTVAATGTGLTYQWQKGGVDIGGETASSLTLPAVVAATAGNYRVIVRGTCDAIGVISNVASLTVNEVPEITLQPVNSTICEGTNTSFTVNAGITTIPTYQWQVSTNSGVSYSNLTNTGIYSGVTTATLNLTGAPLANNGYLYRVQVGGTCTPVVTSNGALLTVDQNPVITTQPLTQIVCEGSTVVFTVAATGTGLTYQWQKGGVDIGGETASSLTLPAVVAATAGNYRVIVRGTCDATGVISNVAGLTVNEVPEITLQPVNSTICEGTNTSFTVSAGLTTLPTYQWQVSTNSGVSYSNLTNTGIYSGVTTATLNLTGAPLANNGYLYRVQVGGTCTPGVTSDGALLTVSQSPVITVQPNAQIVCEGSTVVFTVAATGTGLTYQWQKGGVDIGGETTSSLTLPAVVAATAGNYRVIVRGTCDATGVISNVAGLTVNEVPEITLQPVNSTICEGTNTSFTVSAGLTTLPTYQWQVSTNSGVSYSNLTNTGIYSGVTTATLNLTGAPLANNGYLYRVQVGGTCTPGVTSDGAQLTVDQNLVITTQPAAQIVCEGSTVTFSVAAVGTGLTYQWRENGTNITDGGVYSGATTSTLVLTNVPSTFDGRIYSVVLTGTCTGLPSNNASLTVNRIPNAFATDAAICSGQTVNINITNPNLVPLTTFTWTIQSSTNVTGAFAGSGIVISQLLTSTDGVTPGTVTYLIQPSASGCNGAPYAVSVDVTPIPNAAASPQGICSGESSNVLITNPNGVAGTSFSWTVFSSTNVTGAAAGNGSTISQVLTSTDGINAGTVTYRITPAANGCAGNTVDVTVTVNPKPVITSSSTALIQEICSGTSLSFLPNASIGGTTFSWTSSVIGLLTGVTASGNGAITDTPVNSSNSNAVIIYTITPAIGGCNGSPVNFVVTVRPVPTAAATAQIICSGQSTSVSITNPNAVSGTTYTWTVSASNVTGALLGSGNLISQVLTSTDGLNNGTVTYTITPSANGCPGPPFPVTVTVKPVPVMTNSPVNLSQQICSQDALNFNPAATIPGTTFSWTSSISGPINSASVTATGTGAITDIPENTGNVSGTVSYRITPNFNGCDGLPVDLVVTVRPLPSASGADVVICSGSTATINILPSPQNVAGTTFSWTASPSPNVAGASNGNGSTISQTLSTTDASIGTVLYTIIPTAGGCAGPVSVVTVTVNPIATVNAGADFAVCEPFTIPVSGTIGGSATTATWTIVGGAGTMSATTISGNMATATYTVDPLDIAGTVTFRLSSNDPDAAGPCSVVTDDLVVSVNRQARLTLPADYTVCEPSSINLSGVLSGSATSGLWSLVSGNGSLSATSVTGLTATATYTVPVADVGTTLRFQLTTNDPDGFGPCVAESDQIDILVNESAKINAGPDFQVCEDQSVALSAIASGTTTSVLWTGGAGSFSPNNNVNSTYTLAPADIAAGGVTFTITTNDPDAAGPCTITSDQVFVKINKLPTVFLSGLEAVYAENSGFDNLDGFPLGGTFTGPGILAGTNTFNPAIAGFGVITIRYTYTDPITSCTNFIERTTIVNPITDIDFHVLEDNRPDGARNPQICANQGNLTLIGTPPVSAGFDVTRFTGLSPELVPRITFDGTNYRLNSDGLLAGTYQLQYTFTNEFGATTVLTKDLIVFSAPVAVIDVGNNCIEDVVTFAESSSIPSNLSGGTITSWNWFFDEASNGSNGPVPEPQYSYLDPGQKDISLEVLTDQGCRNKAFKSIVIGKPPVADFSWTSYCKGDDTKFKDLSDSEFGAIDNYSWDFGDGQTDATQNPVHQYANFAVYNVKLTVSTNAGCSGDTTKQVYILDMKTPLRTAGYSTDFEAGPETWVAVANGATVNNSWIFGLPNGNLINEAGSGTNAWWTGSNAGSYFNNEESFVIGPCLNLTDLKRPMISMKYWVDAQKGFDGAVVQYSTNGGDTWQTIGDAEGGGINWYNTRNVSGEPGGQSNFAWSDSIPDWQDGRYNLDQIPLAMRDTVILRIAFGSNDDNPAGRALNGFAFDDIYVGEKNRNVLVEHFTNVNSTASNQANDYLENLYDQQISLKDSSDFIAIQYHMANPGTDQLNLDNPGDPKARALLYGISQPPTTIMDGIQNDYFNGFTANINREELDRRALEDPSFAIEIDTINFPTSNTEIRLAINYTYIDKSKPLDRPVILHAALIERGVNGNGNVVRKLLLQSEGTTVRKTWQEGDNELENIEYTIDVPIVNPDSLYIVAFVQELSEQAPNDTRNILQSAIMKYNRKKGITIVGLPDDPVNGELRDLSIYPNPASQVMNFSSTINLSREYTWEMIDQRGVTVLSGDLSRDFSNGPQRIDISGIANGIYFIAIQTGDRSVVHKKVAVMNRN